MAWGSPPTHHTHSTFLIFVRSKEIGASVTTKNKQKMAKNGFLYNWGGFTSYPPPGTCLYAFGSSQVLHAIFSPQKTHQSFFPGHFKGLTNLSAANFTGTIFIDASIHPRP